MNGSSIFDMLVLLLFFIVSDALWFICRFRFVSTTFKFNFSPNRSVSVSAVSFRIFLLFFSFYYELKWHFFRLLFHWIDRISNGMRYFFVYVVVVTHCFFFLFFLAFPGIFLTVLLVISSYDPFLHKYTAQHGTAQMPVQIACLCPRWRISQTKSHDLPAKIMQ